MVSLGLSLTQRQKSHMLWAPGSGLRALLRETHYLHFCISFSYVEALKPHWWVHGMAVEDNHELTMAWGPKGHKFASPAGCCKGVMRLRVYMFVDLAATLSYRVHSACTCEVKLKLTSPCHILPPKVYHVSAVGGFALTRKKGCEMPPPTRKRVA